ncbi:MAG: FGGY-family carbohydrate kinase [Pseudomonadota bacterium]
MHFLGIDIGTSVVKAALFDEGLTQRGRAQEPLVPLTGPPGYAEVDMESVWQAVVRTVRQVLARTEAQTIAAIGISANMVGAWLIDAQGVPVRPGILWSDARTQSLIEQLRRDSHGFMETIFRSSGSVMQQGCTLPLLRWMIENEPESLENAAALFGCKDWIRFKLTGEIATDITEASVAPGDAHGRGRSDAMIAVLGVEAWAHLLPAPQPSEATGGHLTQQAAAELGLWPGISVAIGAGDVPSSVLGAGTARSGQAVSILGTTCLNCVVMDEPNLEPLDLGLTFCLPGNKWLRAMVNVAGTSSLDWIARLLGQATPEGMADIEKTEAMARSVEPGAEGVTFLPYLNASGIIAPFVEPRARGCFFGLEERHGPETMVRAVYEGVALSIRDCFLIMPQPVEEICLIGGGGRSDFWAQMIADICNRRVVTLNEREVGARGAALLAAVSINHLADIGAAYSLKPARRFEAEPMPCAVAAYEVVNSRYNRLRETLRRHWRAA